MGTEMYVKRGDSVHQTSCWDVGEKTVQERAGDSGAGHLGCEIHTGMGRDDRTQPGATQRVIGTTGIREASG